MQTPCKVINAHEITALPFLMLAESDLERQRAQTFWYKEPETIAWIKGFADGDTFWDVGANVGIYSLYCAAMHRNSIIHAFEPHRGNFAHLRENATLNGFSLIYPHHCAILDHGATDVFYEPPRDEIGASGGQAECVLSESHVHYPVWITSLDALVEPFGAPHHVKIDIDGQELRVVRGMQTLLTDPKLRSVLIEVDLAQATERDEVCGIFTAAGFTTANRFNTMPNHSRVRRAQEGILVENVIFTRAAR
jgi:FkbM family methyltransferase